MNDPKKPKEEVRRVSQSTQSASKGAPTDVAPDEEQAVAMTGDKGEGSYEGTKQYQQGYKKFAKQTSPDDARKKAEAIDPDDPSLKQAEQRAKEAGRVSSPSIH